MFERIEAPVTAKQFAVGTTIRIHPASDWFMRGETTATVVKTGRKWLHVMGHRSGKTFKLSPRNVLG